MSGDLPSVVIDNGTGYTKMGYSGNVEPQYIVPTAVAKQEVFGAKASAAAAEVIATFAKDIGITMAIPQ